MFKSRFKNISNGGRKARSVGRFNYEKFMQLAQNSYNVKKYDRAADNCRLAVEFGVQQSNAKPVFEAYLLWIKSLFKLGRYLEVKKICCEARTRFGNQLDLIYFEFKSALAVGDNKIAFKLGSEFEEMSKAANINNSMLFNESVSKLDEVEQAMLEIEKIPTLSE